MSRLRFFVGYYYVKGASGRVRIDESGDRDPDYSLKYYLNGSFQNIADYNHSTGGFNLRGEKSLCCSFCKLSTKSPSSDLTKDEGNARSAVPRPKMLAPIP